MDPLETFSSQLDSLGVVQTDTVDFVQISRRIVDFTKPGDVRELARYAEMVLDNGFKFLEMG